MPDQLILPVRDGFTADRADHAANIRSLELWARNPKSSWGWQDLTTLPPVGNYSNGETVFVGGVLYQRQAGVWKAIGGEESREVTILAVYPKQTWTAMPAAETELFGDVGGLRQRVRTTGMRQFRIRKNTRDAGVAGAKIRVKYLSGTFSDLAATGGAADVLVDGVGDASGPWTDMAAGALNTDSLTIAIFGVSGNGVASPTFTQIGIDFRV